MLCNTSITMARTTAVISVSLPPDILSDLIKWSKLEGKSKTSLIKEALIWYRRWKLKRDIVELRKEGEKISKEFNLKTEEDLYKFLGHGD